MAGGLLASGGIALADEPKAEEVDLLIVGGGLAGLCCALSAAGQGIERITLIEKLDMCGGSGLFSAAAVSVESGHAPDGVDDSLETMIQQTKEVQSFSIRESEYPDYDKVECVFGQTGETYNWLRDLGVGVSEISDIDQSGTWFFTPDAPSSIEELRSLSEQAGVQIITGCAAEELCVDDGVVTGVVANLGGEKVTFRAKAVVLASGGFGSNPDMLARYVPDAAAYGVENQGTVGATGECIEMAYGIGAAGFSDCWVTVAGLSVVFTDEINKQCEGIEEKNLLRATHPYIIVNARGERVLAEDAPYPSVIANRMITDRECPYYLIVANPDDELRDIIELGVPSKAVLRGDTVEELETALGISDSTLVTTVENYNTYCADGEDRQFGKAENYLVAMEEGPYYALEFYTKIIGTMGGVKVDNNMHVLSESGEIIKGLYAAGEVCNRDLFNQVYRGGTCVGCYTAMGRMTGEVVAQELGVQ